MVLGTKTEYAVDQLVRVTVKKIFLSTGLLDNSADSDYFIASTRVEKNLATKMSKYQVFREHLTTIQSAIKTSVCTVADKCFERGIVAESVYQSVVLGSKIPEERARELLIAVGDQIKTDEQLGGVFSVHFIEFVKILEEEPVHKNLAKTLRNACSLSTGRYCSINWLTKEITTVTRITLPCN